MDTATNNAMIQPYSPDWFKLRQGTFTASEIYKLMGEPRSAKDKKEGNLSQTADTYILEKVHEKITGITKSGVSNYATEWGIEHEPLAATWYGKITGHDVQDSFLVFHPDIEGFSCTPDKFVNLDGLCEIKCPVNGANHFKHCMITSDEYFKQEHPNYFWQCVAQMVITGREWCDFVSFDPRVDTKLGLFIYRLHFNIDDSTLLVEKVEKARELFNNYLAIFGNK